MGMTPDGHDMATLDHEVLDWDRVRESTYLVHHVLRYAYPGPISRLRHRLVVVPAARLGNQRRIGHRVQVTGAEAEVLERADRFGNLVVDVRADRVDEAIEFDAWALARRCVGCPPPGLTVRDAERLGYTSPSKLTAPDAALASAGAELAAGGPGGLALAERVAAWTFASFTYEHGVTSVATTAAEALAGGRGVCQDYAHVMLAVTRAAGLAARYVSGHLLGEGGTHAWVEVLLPDPDRAGRLVAAGFDPTNDRRTGLGHLTVAVGRDYADVAPTSGTFEAAYGGQLRATRRVGVTAVEYLAA